MRRLLGGIVALACAAVPFTVAIDHAAAATAQCANQTGVKVNVGDSPATVNVADTTTNAPVAVVVTITGTTFTVASANSAVPLTGASWCVKSSTNTNSGTGTSGASTATNKQGVVQDISYVVLTNVTTQSPSVCYQAGGNTFVIDDVLYTGQIDTLHNLENFTSLDGTCSGTSAGFFTAVSAGDGGAALGKCQILGFGYPSGLHVVPPLNAFYPAMPADLFLCG